MEEKACLCALNRIFGFKPKIALALLESIGSASEIFRISSKDLELMTGPHFRYKELLTRDAVDRAAEELSDLEGMGIRFCGYTEACYPAILKECEDAPVGLYVRSSTPPEDLWKCGIGVVGTRDISPYGREWCSRIVKGFSGSSEKPVVISGLALGTDIIAHQTALEAGLPTIGVMATGPESIYPYRNRETAERMVHTPGCALVTDYPPGTAPLAIHFLRRNRIIAGLSRAVVLIESKIKGGGMTTCRLAYSYNRDVLALPGRIDDLRSQGCNLLISQKIAEPFTSSESLLESMGLKGSGRETGPSWRERLTGVFGSTLREESIQSMLGILSVIERNRGITIEELGLKTGEGYAKVAETAGMLEIEGFISIDLLQRCSINYKNA